MMDPFKIALLAIASVSALAAIPAGHYLGLYTTQRIFESTFLRKKISSQEELEQIVDTEAKKLNLDPTKIEAKFKCDSGRTEKWEDNYGAYACKKGEGYELCLLSKSSRNRATVKHELYHILKDCDGEYSFWRYFCVSEPRATLYGCFGIKL